MSDPCLCHSDDGSSRCPREIECWEAWMEYQNLRADESSDDKGTRNQ